MKKNFVRAFALIILLALSFVPFLPDKQRIEPEEKSVQLETLVVHTKVYPTNKVKTATPVKTEQCHVDKRDTAVTEEKKQEEPEWEPYSFIPFDGGFQKNIHDLCEEYGCEYDLILAVIKTESNFDVETIGDNGNSIGLMQIQPRWWQDLADDNGLSINDPVDNVNLGIIILSTFVIENDGDVKKALKQYNSGNPNYRGNEYTNKVHQNYEWIKEQKNETT